MAFKHHVVAVLAPSWGHQRPAIPILLKMVEEMPNILVTIPVIGQFKAKMDKEAQRYLVGSNSVLKDHIRIVQISDFDGAEFQYWDLIMQLWPNFFEKLRASESITCYSGQTYPGAPKPELCLIDIALSYPLGTRMVDEEKVKVLGWVPPSPSSFLGYWGPPEFGGLGNVVEEAVKLAEEMNTTKEQATIELLFGSRGKIRKIAGLPPMYDYELAGEYNIPGAEERWAGVIGEVSKFINRCGGLVCAGTPIIDGGAIKATEQWMTDLGKACYAVGPCVLSKKVDFDHEESSRGQEIFNFLDNIYKTHGEHSLLYMSFGTSVFPSGDTAFRLIDIILDMEIPLIFAMPHGDTFQTKLPDSLRQRLESSELAIAAKWTPQQAILTHPVTGVFLTHGGQGSVTESLVAGVPMIIWPLQADQPHNATNLTLNLKVAYQLLEVRIKHGLKPLYRGYHPKGTTEAINVEFRQVLKDAFGSDGESKRNIARALSKKLKETWEEGGEALATLRRMLQENFSSKGVHDTIVY